MIRPTFIAITLYVVGVAVTASLVHGEDGQRVARTNSSKQVDWTLLHFGGPDQDSERQIAKIQIVLLKDSDSPFGNTGIAGTKGMNVTISNRKVLNSLEGYLSSALRGNPPREVHGASGSAYHVGEMRITATDGDFLVGINRAGFTLNSDHFDIQNNFYSWTLAKFLDDTLRENTSPFNGIPAGMFDAMSGQSWLDAQKRRYNSGQRSNTKDP